MAMLTVGCNECDWDDSLRGWNEDEDLLGTEFEPLMGTMPEGDLQRFCAERGVKDPWEKFEDMPVCPKCGSADVYWF